MPDAPRLPVVIATDLTPDSEPALLRGRAHADAIGAPWVVLHVIPDLLRQHPLLPSSSSSPVATDDFIMTLTKKAAELVTEQVRRVLGASPDDYRVIVELGDAEDEIVRVAEAEQAVMVVVGAKPREGAELVIGHVAERVVRYAHASVLIARASAASGKVVVATDFAEDSVPAVKFAGVLASKMGVDVTLLHVMQIPRSNALTPVFSALGSPWTPPSAAAVKELEELGTSMLASMQKEHGFAHTEQLEGDPAEVIIACAHALDAEMIIVGSHGRRGLRRLVLGSTAEEIIRLSIRSVLVVRTPQ